MEVYKGLNVDATASADSKRPVSYSDRLLLRMNSHHYKDTKPGDVQSRHERNAENKYSWHCRELNPSPPPNHFTAELPRPLTV
jgi:hypothetical protein